MEKNIGSLIKEIRKTKKMTQQKLADESNVSRTYLSDVENNRYNPSIQFLQSISNGLSNGNEEEYYKCYLKFMDALGYIDYSDDLEILHDSLYTLLEEENNLRGQIDTINRLIKNTSDEEKRKVLNKTLDNTEIKHQKKIKEIDETKNLIKHSKLYFQKGYGINKELNFSSTHADPLTDSLLENTQTKIELEALFNSTQEITIKGKILTDEEKKKALQILTLTFDK